MTAAPGWFPDPGTGTYLRWWDGNQWTPYTQPFPPPEVPVPPQVPQQAMRPQVQPVIQPPAKQGWWARVQAEAEDAKRMQRELGLSSWEVSKRQVAARKHEREGDTASDNAAGSLTLRLTPEPVPHEAAQTVAQRPAPKRSSGKVEPSHLRVATRWALEEQIEVAGETHHINEIKKVLKGAGLQITRDGVTLDDVPTFLCPEPSNAYDRNAVMVMVGIYLVGYLPAEIAVDYSAPLLALARQGVAVGCQSRIWARIEGGMARARVTLLAPEVDELP